MGQIKDALLKKRVAAFLTNQTSYSTKILAITTEQLDAIYKELYECIEKAIKKGSIKPTEDHKLLELKLLLRADTNWEYYKLFFNASGTPGCIAASDQKLFVQDVYRYILLQDADVVDFTVEYDPFPKELQNKAWQDWYENQITSEPRKSLNQDIMFINLKLHNL